MIFRMAGHVRRRFLGISPEEASFSRRGFVVSDPAAQTVLERAGITFVQGYNAALVQGSGKAVARVLNQVEPRWQGFAYEGAAMALALLDELTPWKRNRLQSFLDGPGHRHIYMVHVGAGWALARLGRSVDRAVARLDWLLRWLVVDGYAFHQGYFYPDRFVQAGQRPAGLTGYALRAFDQGLGRCIWFVHGADIDRVQDGIARLDPSRHADLYSGVGLACAYAGGVGPTAIESLLADARPFGPQLAQGAAFAAKARIHAGDSAPHTELACRMLCGMSADDAARVTDLAQEDLRGDEINPGFEVWRCRVQHQFVEVAPKTAKVSPIA